MAAGNTLSRIGNLLDQLPALNEASADGVRELISSRTPDILQFQGGRSEAAEYLANYAGEAKERIMANAPGINSVEVEYETANWPEGTVALITFFRSFQNGNTDAYVVKVVRTEQKQFEVYHT